MAHKILFQDDLKDSGESSQRRPSSILVDTQAAGGERKSPKRSVKLGGVSNPSPMGRPRSAMSASSPMSRVTSSPSPLLSGSVRSPGKYLGSSGGGLTPKHGPRPQTAPRSSQTGVSIPTAGMCTILPGRLSLSISRSDMHTLASRRSDPLKHFFSSSAHLCANVNVGNVVE